MPLTIIPNDFSSLTQGEDCFQKKLRELYRNEEGCSFLYIKPRLRNLEPDFLLLDPVRGVAIIEVKDWKFKNLKEGTRIHFFFKDSKQTDNPVHKTNQYFNLAKALFESDKRLINAEGDIDFPLEARVFLFNMSNNEINCFSTILNLPPTKIISGEEFQSLTIQSIFPGRRIELKDYQIAAIRSIVFPEIKIFEDSISVSEGKSKESFINSLKVLDANQESFAKRLPLGHYMISGVPGSGKTVVLVSRALYLLKENPKWQIGIVTYTKTLAENIKRRIESLQNEFEFLNVNLNQISISTFHKLCIDITGKSPPVKPPENYWDTVLPNEALRLAKPFFDAVLVDEYQDFQEVWFKICKCVAKKFFDTAGNQYENLFLAGDRLQRIYKVNWETWKEIGINIQGRSKILKKSYRTGKTHIETALAFLKKDQRLKREVSEFYDGGDVENTHEVVSDIQFIEGGIDQVALEIRNLHASGKFSPEEILVLAKGVKDKEKILKVFQKFIPNLLSQKGASGKNKITVTTFHSSKGIETPVTFLCEVSGFPDPQFYSGEDYILEQRRLVYVGMTRSSKILYIHADSFEKSSFAKEIKTGKVIFSNQENLPLEY